jgi:hypothetical protein
MIGDDSAEYARELELRDWARFDGIPWKGRLSEGELKIAQNYWRKKGPA